MTQAELARAVHLAPNSIYRYEAGFNEPDLQTLRELRSYAIARQNAAATAGFDAAVRERAGIESGSNTAQSRREEGSDSAFLALSANVKWLGLEDSLVLIAAAKMLREVDRGDVRLPILRVLLQPWLDEAKKEVRESGEDLPASAAKKQVKGKKNSG